MKKRISIFLILSILVLSTFAFFLPMVLAQIPFVDDTPQYNVSPSGDDTLYSANVQPGNYTVVGFRAGPGAGSQHAYLYSDIDMTIELQDTIILYEDSDVTWQEVGFFTIDGTELGSATPYYLKYNEWHDAFHWAEMENGETTGMTLMNIGDEMTGSLDAMEVFDAYQVYLDADYTYNITLDVPATRTFDLYFCNGLNDEDNALAYSHSDTEGVDENIISPVPIDGYYCIVITNPDYSAGSYSLSVKRLLDDDPGYVEFYYNTIDYTIPVIPGNYTVVGCRAGPGAASLHAVLYSDAAHTSELEDTYMYYDGSNVEWQEAGFFTIDGTGLSSMTPYFMEFTAWKGDFHWFEYENGEATGMKLLNVGDEIDGSLDAMEVLDAYQVYLDADYTYNITLDVPATRTFDLYFCNGLNDKDNALAYSHSDTVGADENIISSVPIDGYYCIVVTNPDYSAGSYSLSVKRLLDDDPGYVEFYYNTIDYTIPVIPGNYTVVGCRAGPGAASLHAVLYSDAAHTSELEDTYMYYDGSNVEWQEAGFFTIDGTGLSSMTPYFMEFTAWKGDFHWFEYENGEATGMKLLNVGNQVAGSLSSNEVIDAYQVSLEAGNTYNITLEIPTDRTFDLFLCSGISDGGSALASSHSDITGADEKISQTISTAGDYCIIVTNPDYSSGTYTLSIILSEGGDGNGDGDGDGDGDGGTEDGGGGAVPGYIIEVISLTALISLISIIILNRKKINKQ
ncbi:MAG: hypothetical protein ACFFDH_01265 [Promethearchaeota archaeon]